MTIALNNDKFKLKSTGTHTPRAHAMRQLSILTMPVCIAKMCLVKVDKTALYSTRTPQILRDRARALTATESKLFNLVRGQADQQAATRKVSALAQAGHELRCALHP